MFTTHFKMTAHPFPARPPLEALWHDARFTEALSRLQVFLEYELAAVITGDEGVGKSSLVRLFMDSLAAKRITSVYIHLTQLKSSALLKFLILALGEKPAHTKDKVLMQILAKLNGTDQQIVCVVDEAHLLNQDALVDLRLLLSGACDNNQFKLLLVGHSRLKKDLKSSHHAALAQRAPTRYHLPPFSPTQTVDYLNFHLARVSANPKLFDENVKSEIYEHTRGVPRLINNLATACLITAVTLNQHKITREILSQALAEFQLYS
jgi:general secretion pathway protein A